MPTEIPDEIRPEDYWTIDQAAEEFVLSRSAIDRALAAGCPRLKLGHRVLLPRREVLKWIKEHRSHWLAYFLRPRKQ